ncbi:MAG: MFS transporter [Rhizobacter sp.]|nr:MFS transporter [Rhizobacter sp.]
MSHPSQFKLLTQRRFGPFFATQLAGAFNDSFLKQVLILLVTYHAADYTTLSAGTVTSLAAGLFILPFVLFSAFAGQLADRFDKARLMQIIKAAEVAIMAVASVGFFTQNLPVLLGSLFLMGTHSAFFGPVKYSYLPRVLAESELVGGNGLLEMGTFMAILTGTIGAGLLVAWTTNPAALSAIMTLLALVGLLASLAIPKTGSAAPDLRIGFNIWSQTLESLRLARKTRAVWLSLLGISWFWFFGALFLSQLPVLAKNSLHGSEVVVTLLLGVFSAGVALGSMLCEKLSGGRVELGLVPFGSIGLSIFAFDLYLASAGFSPAGAVLGFTQFVEAVGSTRVMLDIGLLGMFGGFFIVPLYALVQSRSEKSEQSRIIAANNVLNAIFMVASAAVGGGLLALGATVPQIIGACALLNAVVAVYIYTLLPEFLWRFVAWLSIHLAYRVKVVGSSNIPAEGAALLAPNHVSYLDALVVSAATPRPIRFVMDHRIFKTPVLGWLFKAAKAIPIASAKEDPVALECAYKAIEDALAAGELVCMFPEGALSHDGELAELRPGIARLAERCGAPVVPMFLEGLAGSTFARSSRSGQGLRRAFFRNVEVSAGPALPSATVELAGLRAAMLALRTKHA